VDVNVAGLAGVNDSRDQLAALVPHVDQHRRADRVEIPDVVRDVLEVADIFASLEIKRDQ